MKKTLLGLALGVGLSLPGQAQKRQYDVWNVGLRIGEPFGLNFRSYVSERHAVDVNVGLNGAILGTERNYGSKGQYRRAGLALGANYLTHFALNRDGNFRAYYGFGGQVNSRRSYPDRLEGDYERRLSLGPTGAVGVEYIRFGSPYSFFGEGGLYVEALPRPFFTQLQLGLGVRVKIL